MASAPEAFKRFSQWKNDKAILKVTVIERGQPEHVYVVRLDVLDEDAGQVGILVSEVRQYGTFDVADAQFSIERGRLVVSRDDVEWLIFEEDLED